MKNIFIMRHGQATPMCTNDADRSLTDLGNIEVSNMAQQLAQSVSIDAIVSSPYKRAQQTAQIMQEFQPDICFQELSSDFVPEALPEITAEYLKALIELHPECDNWLIVSHMPLVSYLVGELCIDKMPIFNTAAIACIEFNELTGRGHFSGMQSPQACLKI